MSTHKTTPIDVRLWRKVNKAGPVARPGLTPCWLWTGCVSSRGYGSIGVGPPAKRSTTITTHVLSWNLAHPDQQIPAGHVVRHLCDVKRCVNPEHLSLGTPKDNSADARERGLTAQGERNSHSKLDADTVVLIRQRVAAHETLASLAAEYGVTERSIWDIAARRTWRHLKEAA